MSRLGSVLFDGDATNEMGLERGIGVIRTMRTVNCVAEREFGLQRALGPFHFCSAGP